MHQDTNYWIWKMEFTLWVGMPLSWRCVSIWGIILYVWTVLLSHDIKLRRVHQNMEQLPAKLMSIIMLSKGIQAVLLWLLLLSREVRKWWKSWLPLPMRVQVLKHRHGQLLVPHLHYQSLPLKNQSEKPLGYQSHLFDFKIMSSMRRVQVLITANTPYLTS